MPQIWKSSVLYDGGVNVFGFKDWAEHGAVHSGWMSAACVVCTRSFSANTGNLLQLFRQCNALMRPM